MSGCFRETRPVATGGSRPSAAVQTLAPFHGKGASHGSAQCRHATPRALEQGKSRRPEMPRQAHGDLGHSYMPVDFGRLADGGVTGQKPTIPVRFIFRKTPIRTEYPRCSSIATRALAPV